MDMYDITMSYGVLGRLFILSTNFVFEELGTSHHPFFVKMFYLVTTDGYGSVILVD